MISPYNYIYNVLMNSAGYSLFRLIKPEQAMSVKLNKRLKNAYEGERCFILGNGPSLNDVNFSDLKEEYVFTVNQLMRRSDFEELNTNFHLWSDFNFFKLDMKQQEDVELLDVMKKVNTKNNKPICFFPADVKDFVDEHGLNQELLINYFKIRLKFYEGFRCKIDYSKFVPSMSTVVHYAIFLAVYMGFSEIYLLGCDSTGIAVTIKSALKNNDERDYTYELTENEKKRMYRLLEKNSIEEYARSFWHLLMSYRVLNNYCKTRKVALYNCTSQTVIDSIPRVKLTEVLANKQVENQKRGMEAMQGILE